MNIPLIFVTIGILAFLTVVYLLAGSRAKGGNLDDLAAQLRRIDVGAFRNLINEREEEFLRESLPWHEFRRIHGERMLAAVDYVRGAASNASILIRLAEAAASDPDPTVATAAHNLLENATNVRLHAFQQIPRFYLSILVPGLNHAPHSLAERYDAMTRQGTMLNCLRPSTPAVSVAN
jgi:hypothetical protein